MILCLHASRDCLDVIRHAKPLTSIMTAKKQILEGQIASGPEAIRLFALAQFQSAIAGQLKLPTERKLIEETLNLANVSHSSADQEVKRIYCWFLFGAVAKHVDQLRADLLERSYGLPSIKRELLAAREAIRTPLDHIISDLPTARLRNATQVSEWLARVEVHGQPRFERGTIVYRALATPTGASTPGGERQSILPDVILPHAAWALALLLDKNRDFGSRMRRCGLPECGNLFLALPGKDGGRPSRYCGEEHTAEARRLQAAERSQRYRTKVAARHK
jgi:hypothetical protein